MQGERKSFVPWPPKLLTIDRYPKTNFQCHSSIHGPELLRHPWHHTRCYCRGAGILERKNYWQLILFCGSACPNLAEEIKRAYKKAALTHHPDKVPPHRFWHVEKPGKEFFRFECKSLDTNFVENTWNHHVVSPKSCQGGDEDKFKECGAAVETLTDERTTLEEVIWGGKIRVVWELIRGQWCDNDFLPPRLYWAILWNQGGFCVETGCLEQTKVAVYAYVFFLW